LAGGLARRRFAAMTPAVTAAQATRSVLDNGIILVSETLPARQQVALSITIAQGSRHQRRAENGFAHLMDHILKNKKKIKKKKKKGI
jgi:predicted Zn-dependent peptidase